jgi:hypothetical protein
MEPGLRGSPEREVLTQMLAELEHEAIAAEAEERTLKVIRSARAIADFDHLPLPEAAYAMA